MPTNHLYLGDIVICPRERAAFPDITVEEGIRIFLTGGMALPAGSARGAATIASAISGYNPRLLGAPSLHREPTVLSVRRARTV